MSKSVTNPEELGGLASQVTSDYGNLAVQGRMAAATAEPKEVKLIYETLTLIMRFLQVQIIYLYAMRYNGAFVICTAVYLKLCFFCRLGFRSRQEFRTWDMAVYFWCRKLEPCKSAHQIVTLSGS